MRNITDVELLEIFGGAQFVNGSGVVDYFVSSTGDTLTFSSAFTSTADPPYSNALSEMVSITSEKYGNLGSVSSKYNPGPQPYYSIYATSSAAFDYTFRSTQLANGEVSVIISLAGTSNSVGMLVVNPSGFTWTPQSNL